MNRAASRKVKWPDTCCQNSHVFGGFALKQIGSRDERQAP